MKSAFEIPFVGLKLGTHEFEFDVNDSFFASLPYSLIEKGSVKVWLDLEKKETMMIANFECFGHVEQICSRCNESALVEIDSDLAVIYKFGHEEEETNDDNLLIVNYDAYELDVSQQVYEMISLALPIRPMHEEGECDEEMVKLIEKYQVKEEKKDEDDIDPRWSVLNGLN
ncbi:MAG: YceD family protein [Crocinitomicaceae bacterium]